jgi:hypothetical protein
MLHNFGARYCAICLTHMCASMFDARHCAVWPPLRLSKAVLRQALTWPTLFGLVSFMTIKHCPQASLQRSRKGPDRSNWRSGHWSAHGPPCGCAGPGWSCCRSSTWAPSQLLKALVHNRVRLLYKCCARGLLLYLLAAGPPETAAAGGCMQYALRVFWGQHSASWNWQDSCCCSGYCFKGLCCGCAGRP